MLNFNRDNAKPTDKLAAKPAPYPYAPVAPAPSGAAAKTPASPPAAGRDTPRCRCACPHQRHAGFRRADRTRHAGKPALRRTEHQAQGVEISDCDVLIVEGQVEATVNSKAMQIAKPGTLKGVVVIDVAEIDGEFSGELTAHTKLVVRSTGRVSGKIRYGRLIVADGGELSGDVQRIESVKSEQAKTTTGAPVAPGTRVQLSPQPLG